jgi:transcriptional regulator with XRE-family HTH domain
MNAKITFKQLFDSARDTLPYKIEGLILDVTEQVASLLHTCGMSRSKLAEKLNTSPAYVTKFLSGGTNFTLASMAKVADAFDCDISVKIIPRTSFADWILVLEKNLAAGSQQVAIQEQWRRLHKPSQTEETNRLIGCGQYMRTPDIEWLEQRP